MRNNNSKNPQSLFIFTELYRCGKVGRIALKSFCYHHPNTPVHVFCTEEDIFWLGEHPNVIVENSAAWKHVQKGFDQGHSGTARLWSEVIRSRPETYIIHFDSDVIFLAECLSDITSKFNEGFDLVGSIRNYRHNPNNRDDVRHLPDLCQTAFFGFNRKKITRFPRYLLRRMCKGTFNPYFHPVIDFFDPVMFDIIRNGGRVFHLSQEDYGGCDYYGKRRGGPYPTLNTSLDIGKKFIHFSSVESGMNFYEHAEHISNVPESYKSHALERYALFCRLFYNETIRHNVNEEVYQDLLGVVNSFRALNLHEKGNAKEEDSIDVVIPVYNGADYVVSALDSINAQTLRPRSIIVVNDGSTDETLRIVTQYVSSVPITVINQDNKGLSAARNRGICVSNATYICFLDADDIWESNKLRRQLDIFHSSNVRTLGVVYTDYYMMGKDEEKITCERTKLDKLVRGGVFSLLLNGNKITGSGSGVMVRSQYFDIVGTFDESLQALEDWDMWLRLAKICNFDFVQEKLVGIRRHGNNMSSDEKRMHIARIKVLNKWIMEISRFPTNLQAPGSALFVSLSVVMMKKVYDIRFIYQSLSLMSPSLRRYFFRLLPHALLAIVLRKA